MAYFSEWSESAKATFFKLKEKAYNGSFEADYIAADEDPAAHIYNGFYVNPNKPDCFASDEEVDKFRELNKLRMKHEYGIKKP